MVSNYAQDLFHQLHAQSNWCSEPSMSELYHCAANYSWPLVKRECMAYTLYQND